MLLGIEIGGTKLQLGVSDGEGTQFADFRRLSVDPGQGAAGIRRQIQTVGAELIQRYRIQRVGIGFGGPIDSQRGLTTKSHQIAGWDAFPLRDWCRQELGCPVVLGNDCDVATLAEARYGAGRGKSIVFYVTIGTGVGGGCVCQGQLLGQGRPAIAEIGHLRPGTGAVAAGDTVESIASGWGIARTARQLLAECGEVHARARDELKRACRGDREQLTAVMLAAAAARGNPLAKQAIERGVRTLGWAIAQVITLLAPEVIVVGGGVSLMSEELFLEPLRHFVGEYVFPPLAASYEIAPARLGEEVVVYGAVALAKQSVETTDCSG